MATRRAREVVAALVVLVALTVTGIVAASLAQQTSKPTIAALFSNDSSGMAFWIECQNTSGRPSRAVPAIGLNRIASMELSRRRAARADRVVRIPSRRTICGGGSSRSQGGDSPECEGKLAGLRWGCGYGDFAAARSP